MTDEEVIESLRSAKGTLAPVALAALLGELAPQGLTQATLVSYFKRAFPAIPLRVLLDAGAWTRLSGGGMTDAEFDDHLAPWLAPIDMPPESEAEFWRILEAARRLGGDDCDTVADAVVAELALLPVSALDAFQEVQDRLFDLAYTHPLWAAAYIINHGCSDDSFADFRMWVLSRGRDVFYAALRDPESLVGVVNGSTR